MITLTFLGMGGAMATHPADNHTALLVQNGELSLLLDCGPTIMRQLERVGLTAGDPTHVYLSHQHGDHILGLPMLLLNRVLFWPDKPLYVMAERDVLDLARQLVRIAYPDLESQMLSTVHYVPLSSKEGSSLPGASQVRYELAPGRHSVPTWAIRLDFATRSLVYTSDTGRSEAIARLSAGVDVLVHEAYFAALPERSYDNHSIAEDVALLAEQAGVKTLVLAHRQEPDAAAAPVYQTAAERHFSGTIVVPGAGDRYQI